MKDRHCYMCGKLSWGKSCKECFTMKRNRGYYRVSNKSSPIKKNCKSCGAKFYGWGKERDNFCSEYCRVHYHNVVQHRVRDWRRRNLGIRQLRKFGIFISMVERGMVDERYYT